MANYKLITHESVGATSELMFTAGGTNTVVSSITAKDGASQTAEVLVQKGGTGAIVEMAEVSLTSNTGFQIIDVAFALEATDKLYIRSSRGGMKFIMSYVEETELPNDTALSGLVDVDTTGVSDGDVIAYSSGAGVWQPVAQTGGGGGSSNLDGLSDVSISSSATGDFLLHNGTNYVDQNFDSKVSTNPTVFGHTTKLALVTVTQNVDLDSMETNVATNNGKTGYTTGLFAADFNNKTTADLQEASGSKYYTEARVSANADVTANSAKISYTDAAAVAANTAKTSYTDAAAVALNTAKDTYPSGDATKVGHISVTQAVDLDTMETGIGTATAMATTALTTASTVQNALSSHTTSIENHADVTFAYTGLNRPDGAHLVWDTDHWGEEVSGLDHLADVDLTTTAPSVNDILEWDGTNWVPTAPPTGGGSANVTIDANTTPSGTGDYNDGATIMNLTSVNATVAAGKPYYLGANGWTVVSNSNATGTANTIAMCTSDSTTGSSMLREGVIKVSDNLSGNVGDKVYLHTGSKLTTTEPTSAATVREMGVLLDATNDIIYFKPSDVSLTIQ